MEILEIVNQIKEIGLKNEKRHKSQKTHFVDEKCTGFRQGDIYVLRVPDNHPVGQSVKSNQIADGVSIGARHILNGDFTVYEGVKSHAKVQELHSRAGLGYAFDVEPTTVLTHPEHDNYVFKTKGRFQVHHQVDLRTLRRVVD